MATLEKHGGQWLDLADGELVFERYDPVRDLILVVQRSGIDQFRALIFEKIPDYRWTLPFWSIRKPEGWFERLAYAQVYLNARLESEFPV